MKKANPSQKSPSKPLKSKACPTCERVKTLLAKSPKCDCCGQRKIDKSNPFLNPNEPISCGECGTIHE